MTCDCFREESTEYLTFFLRVLLFEEDVPDNSAKIAGCNIANASSNLCLAFGSFRKTSTVFDLVSVPSDNGCALLAASAVIKNHRNV